MAKTGSSAAAPVILALAAGSFFGAGGTISQLIAGEGFAVPNITCAQFIAAFAMLGAICLAKRYPLPPAKAVAKLALVGVLNALTTMTYYLAIDRLSVGCAVAFQFQYVWIALVLGCLAARSLPTVRAAVCAALVIPGSLLGSGLVDEVIAGSVSLDGLGIAIACACAIFYALYMHFNAAVELEYPALQRTFFMVAGGMVTVLAIAPLLTDEPLTFAIAPYGAVMGLVMSVVPMACLAAASAKLSGSMVAVLSSSELPVAMLVGVIVLGETCTPLQILGAVIICGAIAASNKPSE